MEVLREAFEGQELLIGPALETFATEKARRRKLGRVVDDFDLLIGATAIIYDLTLVTRNTRHFADMVGIVLEDWGQEYEDGQ